MKKEYEVRSYRLGDEEEVTELLELVFDGWPHFDIDCTPLVHWRWKYQENPMKAIVIQVAIGDDRIVGCCHLTLQRTKIGDEIFHSGNEADVAVHPEYRRRGVYNKMKSLQEELTKKVELKFLYGVESNPILIKKNLELGGDTIFPYLPPVLVRIQDVDLHLRMIPTENAWLKKYGFHMVNLINKAKNVLIENYSSVPDLHIAEIHKFDARVNSFWGEIKDHYNFIVERTKDYLNWRYCDPRGGNYLVKIFEENDIILGYSVLKINRYEEEYPYGYIVDLLAIQTRPDIADALVADAINYFDGNNINIVRCLIFKNHSYERVFNKYGFVDSRSRMLGNYAPCMDIEKELNKFHTCTVDKMHFVYGDFDHV